MSGSIHSQHCKCEYIHKGFAYGRAVLVYLLNKANLLAAYKILRAIFSSEARSVRSINAMILDNEKSDTENLTNSAYHGWPILLL